MANGRIRRYRVGLHGAGINHANDGNQAQRVWRSAGRHPNAGRFRARYHAQEPKIEIYGFDCENIVAFPVMMYQQFNVKADCLVKVIFEIPSAPRA